MTNFKKILFCTLLASLSFATQAQDAKPKNTRHTIFVEILGYTDSYSINYDASLYQKPNHGMSLRLGFAYLVDEISSYDFNINKAYAIPASLNWFWGTRNFYIGIGGGVNAAFIDYGDTPYLAGLPYTYSGEDGFKILPVANLNFRYQPQEGLFFQIIATSLEDSPFGVGIGWSF